MSRQRGWRLLVKKSFDRLTAAVVLVVLSPVFLIVAGVVLLAFGRPIFFRQRRPGFKAQPFEIVKFRTMREERDPYGELLPDAARLTRVGRFLRSTSLDELPQFWNVLRGELSVVGPRPLLMQYLPRYSPRQAQRHDALPGITGWAQIKGRNDLSWDEKFELDVWYVENWSLGVDLKILATTVARVIQRHGISRTGHVTTTEFMGSELKSTKVG